MQKTVLYCALIMSLFVFGLFFVSSCNPPGETNPPPVITVTNPEGKYYTSGTLPSGFDYSLSETCPTVEVTLNGVALNPGDDLSGSATGLNTFSISATDEGGATTVETIVYFYNDMTLLDADDFNRADSATVGNGWSEVDMWDMLWISSNRLAASGSDNIYDYPGLNKVLNGAVKQEVLQKIDIVGMTQDTTSKVYLILHDFSDYVDPGDYFEQVQAEINVVRVANQFMGYQLLISVYGAELSGPTNFTILAESNVFNIDLSNPVAMAFYEKGNDYAAVLYDDNRDIIASLQVTDYDFTDLDSSGFTGRHLQIMPYDNTSNSSLLVTVDNYEYY